MEISVFGYYGDVSFMIVSFLIMAYYWYFTSTFNYWRDRGVFFVKPVVFFGNMKDRVLFRQSFHEHILEMYNKFNGHKYAGCFEGRRPYLMIRDPELIKCVLIKDFEHFVDRPVKEFQLHKCGKKLLTELKGSDWKAVRSVMTPTFSSSKMRSMEKLVLECGRQMEEYLQQNLRKEGINEFEMKEFFGHFTLEVIASCAFGITSNSLKDPDSQFVKRAARFNSVPVINHVLFFLFTIIVPEQFRFVKAQIYNKESICYLVAIVQDVIRQRRVHKSERRNDFIQLMLDAAKKENDGHSNIIDDDTIISQSLLFIGAGYDSTSTLLSFACYELAQNPEVQTKLREEIVDVLSRHNNECSYNALQEMTYLEMVLFETLRKYPSVCRIQRECAKDYTLPGTSVVIEKNVIAAVSIIGLHYDPAYYPDPQRFDPERFSAPEKAKRSPYVYLPFGDGPRKCIGIRFGMMMAKVGMVCFLKDYAVQLCAKSVVPYKYNKYSFLLKSHGGLWLDIQRK